MKNIPNTASTDRHDTKELSLDEINRLRRDSSLPASAPASSAPVPASAPAPPVRHVTKQIDKSLLNELIAEMEIEGQVDQAIRSRSEHRSLPRLRRLNEDTLLNIGFRTLSCQKDAKTEEARARLSNLSNYTVQVILERSS